MEVQKLLERDLAHGNPLGVEEATATKQVYGWHYEEDFFVPEEVTAHFNELKQKVLKKKMTGMSSSTHTESRTLH